MKLENLQKVLAALHLEMPGAFFSSNFTDQHKMQLRRESIQIVQDEIIAASPKGEVIISKIGEHFMTWDEDQRI